MNDYKPDVLEFTVWDTELAGLGIRVWPSGKKFYILKYRSRDGRQRKPTIGEHGVFTLMQSRDVANEYKRVARFGNDLLVQKQKERDSLTLREFGEKNLEYVIKRKKKSAKEDTRTLDLRILPKLGGMKINAISS